jgi:hypothetical protein
MRCASCRRLGSFRRNHLWHFDAAERAPSTTSFTSFALSRRVRDWLEGREGFPTAHVWGRRRRSSKPHHLALISGAYHGIRSAHVAYAKNDVTRILVLSMIP